MNNALVWGSSGSIGQAILSKLNDEGWKTVGVNRGVSNSPQNAKHVFENKLIDPLHFEETVYLISQVIGQIDFMCYAAGDISFGKVAELAPQDWQRMMSANLNGVFYAIHYSLPLLNENAHIFIIGAVSERLRLPGLAGYAASKAGLEAFVETLGKEERKKRITLVRPGAVATPFWEKVPLSLPKDAASTEKVADKIYAAYLSGHKGKLDLV